MVEQYLLNHYQIGRLHSSYLISTDDNKLALRGIELFLQDHFFSGDIEQLGEYLCIRKSDNRVKNITIDQIRQMQIFLNQTSVITGRRVVVVYSADEMNMNSANSCLKILEEPPEGSYIFLVTENANHLSQTIRSRCSIVNCYYHLNDSKLIDSQFIKPFLNKTTLNDQLNFITSFAKKDRKLWSDFSKSVTELLSKFAKKSITMDIVLSKDEHELFNQFQQNTPLYFQRKYQSVKLLVDQTNNYDLDLQTSVILILDTLKD